MAEALKIGLTFDRPEDYGIESNSSVFADFSTEKEILHLADAIKRCGHEVELIGNMYKLKERFESHSFDCDLVFVTDEGISSRNREMLVPALLELNGVPYIGSDTYAMGLSQNKLHTKLVARYLGIKTPREIYVPYDMFGKAQMVDYIESGLRQEELKFPLVVKPNCEGYSMGVFKVETFEELMEKVAYNMETYHQEVLCEEYIPGEEINVPVVGTGASAYVLGVDICKHEDGSNIDIFTLHHKCFEPIVDEAVEYGKQTMDTIFDWTLKLHRHFGCRHFSRADYKVTEDKEVYFLELNPRPGLTENGPFETCAKSIGKTYDEVVGEIIRCAIPERGV